MKLIRIYILFNCIFYSTLTKSQTDPGILTGAVTVCSNSNNGTLTLGPYTGNILRWEYSLNGSSLWTPIANTSSSYGYSNLSQTTYFRVIVQDTGWPAASSNSVVITTDNQTNGGTASVLSPTECLGNTVKTTVSNYTGSILNWQFSINNGASWNTAASSNDSISKYYSNITLTTLYRATIKNGVCPAKVSDSVKVIVAPLSVGGTAASSATVCQGTNSATINLTGQTGSIIRWESSPSGSSPWTTINNSTSSLTYNNILNSTYYRAVSKSGNCAEAPSASVLITSDNTSNGGFISGTQSVCSTFNSGILNLNGNNGTISQWEFSTDGGTNWNTTSVNTSSYTFSNISQNTLYRVQVVNGVCPPIYSGTFLVTVKPLPFVNYTFTPGCQGKSVNFTNTSVGNNLFSWDFADSGNSSIVSPSHTYSSSGTFQVKLTASAANGCIDSIRKSVIVYAKPNVNFSALDSACGFKQINFTNNTSISSGTVTSYSWNFGDNSAQSSTVNPNHTYGTADTYVVKLTASSSNGCKDSVTRQIQIFPKPIADYTTNNTCKKSAANFVNTSYIDGGGIFYNWNFGDAQTSALTSPTHTYLTAGSYNVSLITISNHGCKDTVIKRITINEQPDLLINPVNVCFTKAANFTQTISPNITGYTLNWNLGNGDFLTGSNPNYVYSIPGYYQVTAVLTTDSGCVSTDAKTINIYPSANAAFNFNNVCSSDSAIMANQSFVSSGSISYLWNFGNGSNSIVSDPKVIYSSAGTYDIKLTVTTNKGCVDSLIKPITIYDSPVTNFSFTNVCDGNPIQFNNTSTVNSGVIAANSWNFGDNSNSSLVNPSKQYLNNGTFLVNLETTSSMGCKSNVTKTVNVYEGPKADFSFINQCLNVSIPFTNSTFINTGTFNSFWNFGDTTTSNLNSPDHIYQSDGTKQVTLTVVTNNGCRDSISKSVQVYPIPKIFAGTDTTISNGYSVQLNASGGNTYAWSPTAGLNNPVIGNPIAMPNETTVYIAEGTSVFGCYSNDTIIVTIDNNFLVIPYNIVTPDGNGKNDVWFIKNIESYPANKVTIMDEWGVVIYEKLSYANTWDGKNTRGEILPDGTYFYILTFDGSSRVYKGFITLLRNK